MDILSDDGILASEMTTAEANSDSLGAAEWMRRCFPPELVAAVLTQVALRRRAREKLPVVDRMFFTPDGLERATHWVVARWRAAQFVKVGVSDMWGLGCGIGVDVMAFAEVGFGVRAVESDLATAVLVRADLALSGGGEVTAGRAEDARASEGCRIFLDSTRCTARGWTWDVADSTPPWSLVEDHLRGQRVVSVELDLGLPKRLIPGGAGAVWVSVRGDVAELMLSNALDPGPRAVVFPRSEPEPHVLTGGAAPPPVAPPGRFVHEPDNVAIRAGLAAGSVPDGWLLAPGVIYVPSDSPIGGPFVIPYRVIGMLDHDITTFRR